MIDMKMVKENRKYSVGKSVKKKSQSKKLIKKRSRRKKNEMKIINEELKGKNIKPICLQLKKKKIDDNMSMKN